MNRAIVIAGHKTALVEMTQEDQPYFRQWLVESPTLRAMIDNPSIPSAQEQQEWFERSQQPDRRMFSIISLPQGKLLGNGGFVDIGSDTAQFRITLGNTSQQGKGHGSEATRLLLRYAFTAMNLSIVWLRVRPDNAPARHIYEKVGMRVTPSHPEDQDKIRMEITREEFLASHPA